METHLINQNGETQMCQIIEKANASFSRVFNMQDLTPQFNSAKNDLFHLCAALQECGFSIQLVSLPDGFSIYHYLSGERVRESYYKHVLTIADIQAMKTLKRMLAAELERVK